MICTASKEARKKDVYRVVLLEPDPGAQEKEQRQKLGPAATTTTHQQP
jgi:hypothetical protein